MRFAADTGGTFTDLVIEADDGGLSMFKASTVPGEPVRGVLAAFDVAADAFGIDRRALLSRGSTFIHGTTHAINAIVTQRTAKTALLVTRGHPDILVLREGGRLEPFNHSVPFPTPYVPRALTFEVTERVLASGEVRTALDESTLVATLDRLRALQVEAVAVCLLWSVVNPAHEQRIGELLVRHLPDVPFTLSHRLNPSIREYRRAIASAIDASLKPLMTRYLGGLSASMRDAGFPGRLLVLTSQGSMVEAEEVRQAPILALKSGPSMAPVAGGRIAAVESPLRDVIVFDTGGTTFDVSLVRNGRVPYTQETWLGRPYQSDLTGFPSVDVKSIGAGGGSIAWVDGGGMLHVGPQSAGSVPGPACYPNGGNAATVTDASVVLGYIDPDYFLGGRLRLDRASAQQAVQRDVATPLGLDLHAAAASVLSVWTENMVQAIADITVNQGIDPATAVIVGGGGAAGLNAVAIAHRLGCATLIVPGVAAGLSAAGAIASDIGRDFRRIFVTSTKRFDPVGVARVIAELRADAHRFAEATGSDTATTRIDLAVEARYTHQVWEIDVAVDPDQILGLDAARILESAFHRAHEQIFGFHDDASAVEAIAWRISVRCAGSDSPALRLKPSDRDGALRRKRRIYFAGTGWQTVPILSFDAMGANERVRGPAIIESPFTSVVIDPTATVHRSTEGNLVVDWRGIVDPHRSPDPRLEQATS
ncbi:MAG: hydantoinase/oxoprolinase family protein [Burkholderiales bacterium]|nr:hydantoinase/oxoprolinase family protein [Burkholderiales bacterium]